MIFYLCLCFFELWRHDYIGARNPVCRRTDARSIDISWLHITRNIGRSYALGKSSRLEAIHSSQHFGCVEAHCCWVVEDKADSMFLIDDEGGTRLERKSFGSAIGVEVFSVFVVQAKLC